MAKNPQVRYRVVDNRAHDCVELYEWANPIMRRSYARNSPPAFRYACREVHQHLTDLIQFNRISGSPRSIQVKVQPAEGAGWTWNA
ncbi:MAG: hypothetical protein V6Z86_05430 [Hyphomicrobiales bacterium]